MHPTPRTANRTVRRAASPRPPARTRPPPLQSEHEPGGPAPLSKSIAQARTVKQTAPRESGRSLTQTRPGNLHLSCEPRQCVMVGDSHQRLHLRRLEFDQGDYRRRLDDHDESLRLGSGLVGLVTRRGRYRRVAFLDAQQRHEHVLLLLRCQRKCRTAPGCG